MAQDTGTHIYAHKVEPEKVKVEVNDGRVFISVDTEGGYVWLTLFTDEVASVARKLGEAVVSH